MTVYLRFWTLYTTVESANAIVQNVFHYMQRKLSNQNSCNTIYPRNVLCFMYIIVNTVHKDDFWKVKRTAAVPLQAWRGPERSRKLRFPDFMTKAQDGGKVVSLTHRPPLPPGNKPGTHFC
jgi:hypothetical protein